jgi:esterase/lipase superfamily enzyme
MVALAATAVADPTGALSEIEALLADPAVARDPRLAFDLNRLAAELLEGQGRLAEAAALVEALARFAADPRNREILGADPAALWRSAARLHAQAGDPAAALRAEAALLEEQRDAALPGDVLAGTLDRMAAIAQAQGDAAGAARHAAAAALARQPEQEQAGTATDSATVPPSGTRGDGQGYTSVEVFYATDRARSGSDYPAEFYGAGRGALETGIAVVTIPDAHQPGDIEKPTIWRLEFAANPARHVTLRNVSPLPQDAFYAEMQDRMGTRDRREAFVFVHGYNVTFDAAAKRAAQLAYDMNFAGLPIVYSWPSRGSTLGYIPDAAVVQLSGRRLTRFLEDVVARSGAETVHIIAHSMGNRAVTEALELMAVRREDQLPPASPPFGQIIFAAPDVDAGLFAEMLPAIRTLARRLTLYASENDWALVASQKLHGDSPRAGQGGADILAAPGIDSVDMSALGEDMLAHGYFAGDRSALVDLVSLIWRDLDPGLRCGLVADRAGAGGTTLWRYEPGTCPDDALLAVMGQLQAEGIETVEDARIRITRLVPDPVLANRIEPVVTRMLSR